MDQPRTWRIVESERVLKLTTRDVPKHVLGKYQAWKNVVETSAPIALHALRGYRDHALSGKLEGFRSSYLSDLWRVIYIVQADLVVVLVQEITPHVYRSRGRDPAREDDVNAQVSAVLAAFATPRGFRVARQHVRLTSSKMVRFLREASDMSQAALAKKAGMSQAALSAIESGRIRLGLERATRLARALGINPVILLFPNG